MARYLTDAAALAYAERFDAPLFVADEDGVLVPATRDAAKAAPVECVRAPLAAYDATGVYQRADTRSKALIVPCWECNGTGELTSYEVRGSFDIPSFGFCPTCDGRGHHDVEEV